mgnify:CR=1 FL=1
MSAYDFDMKVDSDGNPHIVLGLLPGGPDPVSGDGYIFPSQEGSGYYYFTIDLIFKFKYIYTRNQDLRSCSRIRDVFPAVTSQVAGTYLS